MYKNDDYKKIWDKIFEYEYVTLCTHVNPDGDTIGGAQALKHLILLNSPNIKEVKISGEKYPALLDWMDKNDEVSDEFFNKSLKIVVDTSTKSRIWDQRVVTKDAIKIDHHHHEGEWMMEVGGDYWPAVGQVISEMIEKLNLKINDKVQEGLFISIWTDTEGLTQRNISADTHRYLNELTIDKEALKKKIELPQDVKDTVNKMKKMLTIKNNVGSLIWEDSFISNDYYKQIVAEISNLPGFEVFVMGFAKPESDYRVSFRSKGKVDISKYASKYGGGGHFTSAGCYAKDSQEIKEIIKFVRQDSEERMTEKIARMIEENDKIVLFHHLLPDGDSLSSSYSLLKAIQSKYPNKTVKWIADKEYIQRRFPYLGITFEDTITEVDETWLSIVGDVSNQARIFGGDQYVKAGKKICFDHHTNPIDMEVDIFWHEPTYIASAIQAYEIEKEMGIKFDSKQAILSVFGIITDSGRFAYSLANPTPLRWAAELFEHIEDKDLDALYQAMNNRSAKDVKFQGWALSNFKMENNVSWLEIKQEDLDELGIKSDDAARVNLIGNIEGVDAWIFFIQYPDWIRVEYRSLGTPVNEVAKQFGGGGHIRASGCKIQSFDEVDAIVKATQEAVRKFKKN